MSFAPATLVDEELRELWDRALAKVGSARGGNELLAEALPTSPDPLGELVAAREVFVEHRDGALAGFAVVRHGVIVGIFVASAWRKQGVARSMARELFAMADPPKDALALPGDRATKSLYESLGLKARLLTMRGE